MICYNKLSSEYHFITKCCSLSFNTKYKALGSVIPDVHLFRDLNLIFQHLNFFCNPSFWFYNPSTMSGLPIIKMLSCFVVHGHITEHMN